MAQGKKNKKQQADDELAQLIAAIEAGPQLTADVGGRAPTPIGVPSDYIAFRESDRTMPRYDNWGWGKRRREQGWGVGGDSAIPPRYFDGHQYRPAAWTPAKVARFQEQLMAAGLYKKGTKIRLGYWSDADVTAYEKLLSYANRSGLDERRALTAVGSMPRDPNDEDGDGIPDRAPLTKLLTNPTDLREMFNEVARKRIGKRLDPQTLDGYVAAYQQIEGQTQEQAYGMEETGGTITRAPDPSSFISSRLKTDMPEDFLAMETVGHMNEFFDLLGES